MILADYPGHLIAGLLLIVPAVLVFFAFRCSELQKPARRLYRWPLMILQYVAIVILLLILWNPSRSKESKTLSKNSVLVFFDTSRSMSVVEDGRLSRLDKALDIFQEKFSPLDEDGPDYKVFGFDQQAYHCGTSDFLRRWGAQTDMHSLLTELSNYESVEKSPDSKIVAGAVIFSDGQADDKNIQTYLPFGNRDFPIAVIGVGSQKRQTDIAIESINVPSRIAIDTACTMQVVVRAKNLQEQPVTVELLKDDYVVDSKEIPAEAFTPNKWQGDSLTEDATAEFTIGS